ncbi:MAG: transglycosylase domain-containing protein [Polyangiales bacterium]
MLRFLSERRVWVVAAFVTFALVLGLWSWAMPRVSARAADVIAERLGVDAQIEETVLSFGGVKLRGVELRGRHGGFVARVEHIEARMSLLGAVLNGARSVRALSARGVEVTLDLSHEGFSDSIAQLRRNSPLSASASETTNAKDRGRTYSLDGLTIIVLDSDGPLASINDVSLRKEGDDLQGGVGESLLGEQSADHASIGPTKLALRRSEGAWKLRDLEIQGASVRSLRNGDEEPRALATRLRDAWNQLRASPISAETETEPETETGTGTEDGTENATRRSAAPPAGARLFARLTPDARVAVSGVQIESRTPAGHVERIRDFGWALNGGDNGWYRVVVGGQTSNGGALKVDLSVMPSEARAEGSIELRRISLAVIAPFAPEIPFYDDEVGTLSAELELAASSPEQISIEGRLRLRELALNSERIAAEPVENINMDIEGKGSWYPDERLLQVERGGVRMGKVRVLIDGELERTPEHYRVDLTAKLPPTPCNDVIGAIPEDVLGSLARFEWSGNWSALAHASLDSRDLDAAELSIRVRNLCQFERTPRWVSVERFQEPFRHRAIEPDDTVFEMRTGPGTPNWVAFSDMSPFMVAAAISHEDGAFYEHGGFAPWAIRDALVRNLQEGRYVVGASTISMQLAKNLYLQREKTIARKVQEVILTWWLENALNKDEILELYLNVIEYGPAVYGLRHAAAYYFGRNPIDLSPGESAFLACMLPSPKRYHVSYERGALSRSMKSKMRRLLEHMAKRERIGPEALAYGLAELEDFRFRQKGDPLPPARTLPPLGAPEFPDPEALDPFESLFVAP